MISWNDLWLFALISLLLWVVASWLSLRGGSRKAVCLLAIGGLTVFGSYIGLMWHSLGHPPLRTMGETRMSSSICSPTPPPALPPCLLSGSYVGSRTSLRPSTT